MRQYQTWSTDDKQKLHELVKQQGKRQIQWADIAKQMNKTQQQCKSFYQNVLKKEFNISKITYKKWDITKKIILIYASHLYDNNWGPIQEKYFPESSIQQLKNICSSTKGWYNKTVDNILYNYQNQNQLKNLTIQKLEMQLIVLKIIDYRMHIGEHPLRQMPEEVRPYEIFHLPTKHLFELQLYWRWQNIDTAKLIKQYEQALQQKMVSMIELKFRQMAQY